MALKKEYDGATSIKKDTSISCFLALKSGIFLSRIRHERQQGGAKTLLLIRMGVGIAN